MSFQSLHSSAVEAIDRLPPTSDAVELSLRQGIRAFLDAQPLGCARANVPGHVTASTFVFDHARRHVLLTLHPRLKRWVQLGGHCEAQDVGVLDAAAREAREESGIGDLVLVQDPVALRVFALTCSLGVPTRHIDIYFRAFADRDAPIARSDESDDLQWWPIDHLPESSDIGELVASAVAIP